MVELHSGFKVTDDIDMDNHDLLNHTIPFAVTTLGFGTITLQAATTAYDTDYVDIPISAGDLASNDIVYIEVSGLDQDAQSIRLKIYINDVTTPVTGAEMNLGTGAFFARITLYEEPNNSQLALMRREAQAGATLTTGFDNPGTGDNNFFTTAFTIRINVKYASSGSVDTKIRYMVYAIKG